MHYIETYNASEGFFAVQDSPDPSAGMLLLLDHGVFYEFRTLDGTTVVPRGTSNRGRPTPSS